MTDLLSRAPEDDYTEATCVVCGRETVGVCSDCLAQSRVVPLHYTFRCRYVHVRALHDEAYAFRQEAA